MICHFIKYGTYWFDSNFIPKDLKNQEARVFVLRPYNPLGFISQIIGRKHALYIKIFLGQFMVPDF